MYSTLYYILGISSVFHVQQKQTLKLLLNLQHRVLALEAGAKLLWLCCWEWCPQWTRWSEDAVILLLQ